MNCPGCGAPTTQDMIEDGECGYCHIALVRPKVEPVPKIVNVTRVEVRTPDVGEALESVSTSAYGCASGCVSMGITVGISGMVLAFVGYQLWSASQSLPGPPPPPPPPVHAAPPVRPAPPPPVVRPPVPHPTPPRERDRERKDAKRR